MVETTSAKKQTETFWPQGLKQKMEEKTVASAIRNAHSTACRKELSIALATRRHLSTIEISIVCLTPTQQPEERVRAARAKVKKRVVIQPSTKDSRARVFCSRRYHRIKQKRWQAAVGQRQSKPCCCRPYNQVVVDAAACKSQTRNVTVSSDKHEEA